MKICILRSGGVQVRRGYEIALTGEFRGVTVYVLTFDEKMRKKRRGNTLKKALLQLTRDGVSLFGAPSSLHIVGAISERELLLDLRARLATEFERAMKTDADYLLRGGSFRRRVETAVELLRERRTIYLDCVDFEESAEEISYLTGAAVMENPPGAFIAINLGAGDEILSFEGRKITASDFHPTLPQNNFPGFYDEEIFVLAAMLEICGVLRKKEIKVECFVK